MFWLFWFDYLFAWLGGFVCGVVLYVGVGGYFGFDLMVLICGWRVLGFALFCWVLFYAFLGWLCGFLIYFGFVWLSVCC